MCSLCCDDGLQPAGPISPSYAVLGSTHTSDWAVVQVCARPLANLSPSGSRHPSTCCAVLCCAVLCQGCACATRRLFKQGHLLPPLHKPAVTASVSKYTKIPPPPPNLTTSRSKTHPSPQRAFDDQKDSRSARPRKANERPRSSFLWYTRERAKIYWFVSRYPRGPGRVLDPASAHRSGVVWKTLPPHATKMTMQNDDRKIRPRSFPPFVRGS